jgi:hypothetical protein
MDLNQSEKLLEKTFQSKFNIDNYEEFLVELFNTPNMNRHDETQFVKKAYFNYVDTVMNLGNYRDSNGESIGFYAIKLNKKGSRDRARTMQRNLIAQLMTQQHRNAALTAFIEPDSKDWRFSYVKLEYKLDEKGNIKKDLTSARRHSFLVGPNEPNHTCLKQFKELLAFEEKISLKQIEEAFNIENVTDEFFQEYKQLFSDLKDSLDKIIKNDNVVANEFQTKKISTSDFAKKILGQIVFIYFLQKKGWLGVTNEQWGTGSKNFLKDLFDEKYFKYNNFFNNALEPLFYQGLSEDVVDFHLSQFNFQVPFLNGGLFEPMNNYDWQNTELIIDNNIFKKIINTFDLFNFTVKEDEPLEKEVAVDPEMLGKVFESLLDDPDRKSKGAFYTPRKIVHYICQENLIQYLNTNSIINEEDLRVFIKKGDLALESIIKASEEKEHYNGKQFTPIKLPDSISKNSALLEQLLEEVKVVDPAVGSGAFPVGMMNEIVKARHILYLLNGVSDINMYNIKKETIENSLYGVDLEYSATDVTKLRFWLSLIVDEKGNENINPLPNLDNHIMAGNSVIDGFDGIQLFDKNLIKERTGQTTLVMNQSEIEFRKIEKAKKDYFNEKSPNQKLKLKKQIKELKWNFIESYLKENDHEDKIDEIKEYEESDSKPFFIWELEFSEIFQGENPGFDIVIGNPPYVRQEKIKELKPYFKEYYETYTGVADLYVYFFEKGINVLKNNGIFAFICSNKFTKAKYGKELRQYLLNYDIKIYTDFTGKKIFKEASVDTCIIQIKKSGSDKNKILVNNDFHMDQSKLTKNSFGFYSPKVLNLKEKIDSKGIKLGDIENININRGILTGLNNAFIINKDTKDKLIKQDFKNNEIIKPILRGKDIKRYLIDYHDYYLILSKNGINVKKDYPSIYKYLESFGDKIKNRSDKGNDWSNLRNCAYYGDFEKSNIKWQEIAPIPHFVYDEDKYYCNNSCYILTCNSINLKYLTALLNSNLLFFIFKKNCYNLGKKGNRFTKQFIEKIPIKMVSEDLQIPIINLVNEIQDLMKESFTNSNPKDSRLLQEQILSVNKKIDELVYKLYELTPEEIKIVEQDI